MLKLAIPNIPINTAVLIKFLLIFSLNSFMYESSSSYPYFSRIFSLESSRLFIIFSISSSLTSGYYSITLLIISFIFSFTIFEYTLFCILITTTNIIINSNTITIFVSNTFINVFLFNKFTFVPLVPDIQSLLLFLYNPFYLILSLFFLYKL